jgi:DNA-3-methyladenine glycosylase II
VRVELLAANGEGENARASEAELAAIRDEVTWLFSLEEDLDAFYRFAAERDPVLDALCRILRGYRVTRAATLFEALVTAITAQQINLAFACTIRSRLVRAYGRTVTHEGESFYAFPEPAAVAAADPEALRAMQFSGRKAAYIIGLARDLDEGRLSTAALVPLPNEEAIAILCRHQGVGRWTAEWALIRALGRRDLVPADDLGVQQAVARFYHDGERPKASEVRRLAERWHPWESLATYYLLAGLRLEPGVLSGARKEILDAG